MTDHPILFSAPMIKALLDGRKTQTRRIFTPPAPFDIGDDISVQIATGSIAPRFKPGDLLWCREAYSFQHSWTGVPPRDVIGSDVWYWADDNPEDGDWTRPKPGIFMPRWASRLTLVVTAVKVERLQDISEEDALDEGVDIHPNGGFHVAGVPHPNRDFPYLSRVTPREMYAALWDVINGSGAWLENPWVTAISFRVHQCNIGKMP